MDDRIKSILKKYDLPDGPVNQNDPKAVEKVKSMVVEALLYLHEKRLGKPVRIIKIHK